MKLFKKQFLFYTTHVFGLNLLEKTKINLKKNNIRSARSSHSFYFSFSFKNLEIIK